MDRQPEQFDKLITLLKLKRYEVPPPGYFHRFSAQVIARIEILSEQQPSWLRRFWIAFEARPSVAASCGVALGALLVTSFVMTQQQPGESLPWENAGGHFFGQTTTRGNFDSLGEPSLNGVLALSMSNALAPAFIFGENYLRVRTVSQWK